MHSALDWTKALVSGITAVAVAALVGIAVVLVKYKPYGTTGFDPKPLVTSPLLWITAIVIFAVAFYWQYRKLSH